MPSCVATGGPAALAEFGGTYCLCLEPDPRPRGDCRRCDRLIAALCHCTACNPATLGSASSATRVAAPVGPAAGRGILASPSARRVEAPGRGVVVPAAPRPTIEGAT